MADNVKAVRAWKNGKIRTMDPNMPYAEAIAVDQAGRIIYVGEEAGLCVVCDNETVIEDLSGAFMYPGFIDSHLHLALYGETLQQLQIRGVSKQEILKRVSEAAKSTPKGKWIIGGMGWDNETWEDPAYPTLEELDAAAPDHPVMLPRMDGHLIWANSRAYAIAGVDAKTQDPEGGEFMRTTMGTLQGCASDRAADIVKAYIPAPTEEERREALLLAQQKLLEFGVTSCVEMTADVTEISDLCALYENGQYKERVYAYLYEALGTNADPKAKAYLETCPRSEFNGRFVVRGCKILGDGAVGAQSAHMKKDYSDRPGHRGEGMYTDEEMYRMVRESAEHGMQLAVHSIGDATIEQVLNAYERVLKEQPDQDHRWRIEHFQTVTDNTPDRAAQLGCIASMQPMHAPNSAGMARRRLGEERIHGAYAGGLVLRSTGKLALGSDAPVSVPSPISGIHAAVTRTNDQLQPEGGFCMENAITPEQALMGYTVWGAYARFAEDSLGQLKEGCQADMVILSEDICEAFSIDPHRILSASVLKTIIGGETVFEQNAGGN